MQVHIIEGEHKGKIGELEMETESNAIVNIEGKSVCIDLNDLGDEEAGNE